MHMCCLPCAGHLQVSAELLRHLVGLASQHLSGHTPQQVVITVPAYFNSQQREATLEAAQLAGIPQVSSWWCADKQASVSNTTQE